MFDSSFSDNNPFSDDDGGNHNDNSDGDGDYYEGSVTKQ